ncbi:hypothetical protein J2X36_003514 [Methylobacterium sp. BE186]|uniref:hypothetical protein n=1 Tax=Methylobacterium sp. BE186 TaxID=2817715 RepID=UPI00285E8FA6|nr:hypothetical protein [Methylobacterium sp. BE186]MDR7038743.1 hypothetical protein [Methylobacterium sp. BE186]
MIVALLALAVAMMIGGAASVIQGFPFVRLESGLAMVIAGATVASAGAVLAGLAAVADRVRRVERALAAEPVAHRAAGTDLGLPPSPPPVFAEDGTALRAEPLLTDGPRPRPAFGAETAPPLGGAALPGAAVGGAAVGGAALAGLSAGFLSSGAGPDRTTLPPLHAAGPETGEGRHPAEPELPLPEPAQPDDPGLAAARREPTFEPTFEPSPEPTPEPAPASLPEPDDGIGPEDDLFASPEPHPEAAPRPEEAEPEPVALRPALREEPAETHHAAAAEPHDAEILAEDVSPPEPQPGREIVGTHASGGNTYVMYADGSIEAETPRGRYTFNSLDELKAFVDTGGEGETRGAA